MLTWHFKKDKPKGERLSEIVKNWPQRPCLRSTKGYIKITKTPKCSKGCALHQLCSFHKFGGATKQYLHLSVILFFFFCTLCRERVSQRGQNMSGSSTQHSRSNYCQSLFNLKKVRTFPVWEQKTPTWYVVMTNCVCMGLCLHMNHQIPKSSCPGNVASQCSPMELSLTGRKCMNGNRTCLFPHMGVYLYNKQSGGRIKLFLPCTYMEGAAGEWIACLNAPA